MKATIGSSTEVPVFPYGWYSVIDEDGNDVKMLVFECQMSAYRNIERNITLLKGKLGIDGLMALYFDECKIKPNEAELDYFLEYINDMGCMPPYFTFEQGEALEPKKLAEIVNKLFENEAEKEEWLKNLYDSAPVLQEIYKHFYAFKKTIFDAMKVPTESVIVTTDLREEYEIIENYHNLQELIEEVKQMYPKLHTEGLVKVAWSDAVVRSWYALCQRFIEDEKNFYQIHVNRILSSPKVDREVIKYLLFHELLHENGYWYHDDEFRKREWQYPNSTELDGFLDSLNLKYNMDAYHEHSVYFEEPQLAIDNQETKIEDIQVPSHNGQSEPNTSASRTEEGIKYCRNCGNKLPLSAKFCDKCGSETNY